MYERTRTTWGDPVIATTIKTHVEVYERIKKVAERAGPGPTSLARLWLVAAAQNNRAANP